MFKLKKKYKINTGLKNFKIINRLLRRCTYSKISIKFLLNKNPGLNFRKDPIVPIFNSTKLLKIIIKYHDGVVIDRDLLLSTKLGSSEVLKILIKFKFNETSEKCSKLLLPMAYVQNKRENMKVLVENGYGVKIPSPYKEEILNWIKGGPRERYTFKLRTYLSTII